MQEYLTAQRMRIGDLLVQKGLVDEEQLEYALEEQQRNPFEKLGETLVRLEVITEEDLLRTIAEQFPKREVRFGGPMLEVKDLAAAGLNRPVSLTVREGEILGVAGLMGSGRTELARAIFGADRPERDETRLCRDAFSSSKGHNIFCSLWTRPIAEYPSRGAAGRGRPCIIWPTDRSHRYGFG